MKNLNELTLSCKKSELAAGANAISVKPSMYSAAQVDAILTELVEADKSADDKKLRKEAIIAAERAASLEIAREHKAIKAPFKALNKRIEKAVKIDLSSVRNNTREAARELFSKIKAALITPECAGLKGNARRMKFSIVAAAIGHQLEDAKHPVFRNAGYMLLSASGRSLYAASDIVCSRSTDGFYNVTIGDVCYKLNITL